MNCRGSFK